MGCSVGDFLIVLLGIPRLGVMLVIRVHVSEINISRLIVVVSRSEFNLQLVPGVVTDHFAVSELQAKA